MSRDEPSGESEFSVDELDYELPAELIAQSPAQNREDARLLVIDRTGGSMRDLHVRDLPELIKPSDLMVVNDTKVLPARFTARRLTGGRVPGLFVCEESPGQWQMMLEGSRRLHAGELLSVEGVSGAGFELHLRESLGEGLWKASVTVEGSVQEMLQRVGHTPLPPYIRRDEQGSLNSDAERYQTVYAAKPGAVAAPTAGLHLTQSLLEHIKQCGVEVATVTLHVGVGTFRPISCANIGEHVMHSERYELPAATVVAISDCRARGGRVLAVGTTSVRVLESNPPVSLLVKGGGTINAPVSPLSKGGGNQRLAPVDLPPDRTGSTEIFIYPPYRFEVVDMLLTNFHLPRSTLLALVMAFAGVEAAKAAYAHAIRERYRFYSYGDAMLIL